MTRSWSDLRLVPQRSTFDVVWWAARTHGERRRQGVGGGARGRITHMNLEDKLLHVLGNRLAENSSVSAEDLADARHLRRCLRHSATARATHDHVDVTADLRCRRYNAQSRCTPRKPRKRALHSFSADAFDQDPMGRIVTSHTMFKTLGTADTPQNAQPDSPGLSVLLSCSATMSVDAKRALCT